MSKTFISSSLLFSHLLSIAIAIQSLGFIESALACDLCAIYNSADSQKPKADTFSMSLAQQFTEYSKLQQDGHFAPNEAHQGLASSITQIIAGYDLSDSLSLQASLPYINRRFRRVADEEIQNGTEAGIGDLTIIARYTPFQMREGETLLNFQLVGGIKLPTGSSDRLKEELSEGHHHEPSSDDESMTESTIEHAHMHDEIEIPGAVHGHDLALGSGSVDFPVGVSLFAETGRFFAKGNLIYTIRTAGDHQYQYADDLTWDFGPGYFLVLAHDSSSPSKSDNFGLQNFNMTARLVLSGEHKSKDSGKDGEIQGDTGINSLFIGPELNVLSSESRISRSTSGTLALDIPIDIDTSEFQSVASYRLRAGLNFTF